MTGWARGLVHSPRPRLALSTAGVPHLPWCPRARQHPGMDESQDWVNEVRLVGRVSAVGEERELPSGDTVAALRVVVPRGHPSRRRSAAAPTAAGTRVDTIDVACWSGRTRRTARALGVGDVVVVEGALRRRFFRAGGAAASRYEVEAVTLRRVGERRVTASA